MEAPRTPGGFFILDRSGSVLACTEHDQGAAFHYLYPLFRGALSKFRVLRTRVENDALRGHGKDPIVPRFLYHRVQVQRDGVDMPTNGDLVQDGHIADHPAAKADRDHFMAMRHQLHRRTMGIPLWVGTCPEHQGPSLRHRTNIAFRQQGLLKVLRDLTFPTHTRNMAGAALHGQPRTIRWTGP